MPQALDGIAEQRAGEPRKEIGASLSTLMDSQNELSAASQTLMRRASELLQQPGSSGEVSGAGMRGSRLHDRVVPGLHRQEQELTHDEQHLLSDMISVL